MFTRKKKIRQPINVFMNNEQVGQIVKSVGKEIQGQMWMEVWIKFDIGSGAEEMILDTLESTGLYIGRPPTLEEMNKLNKQKEANANKNADELDKFLSEQKP